MANLPEPRGSLSEVLLGALRGAPVDRGPATPAVDRLDPLADEDLQLALYCCYELHYGGLPGVDDRWEWNPWLLRVRAGLEGGFEEALLDELGPPSGSAGPEEMDLALRAIAESDEGPSLSSYVEREASLAEVTEFLIHRSAYQLKEADPHSWALPRLSGPPKAALVEIQADEYGGGRPERIHATMFARSMEALQLDSTPGAYLDAIPGYTLATVNLMSLLGLHRRWRGAIVGHLALFEMTSSIPNRRYANGLRRLGLGETGHGLLRRARGGRRRTREHRGSGPRRRPRAPAARSGPRRALGCTRARRARRTLGRRHSARLGGGRVLAAGRRRAAHRLRQALAARPLAPVLEPGGRPEVGELVGAVAERPGPRAPAAAEGHRLALEDDLGAVHVLQAHGAADDEGPVPVGGDRHRGCVAARAQVAR